MDFRNAKDGYSYYIVFPENVNSFTKILLKFICILTSLASTKL